MLSSSSSSASPSPFPFLSLFTHENDSSPSPSPSPSHSSFPKFILLSKSNLLSGNDNAESCLLRHYSSSLSFESSSSLSTDHLPTLSSHSLPFPSPSQCLFYQYLNGQHLLLVSGKEIISLDLAKYSTNFRFTVADNESQIHSLLDISPLSSSFCLFNFHSNAIEFRSLSHGVLICSLNIHKLLSEQIMEKSLASPLTSLSSSSFSSSPRVFLSPLRSFLVLSGVPSPTSSLSFLVNIQQSRSQIQQIIRKAVETVAGAGAATGTVKGNTVCPSFTLPSSSSIFPLIGHSFPIDSIEWSADEMIFVTVNSKDKFALCWNTKGIIGHGDNENGNGENQHEKTSESQSKSKTPNLLSFPLPLPSVPLMFRRLPSPPHFSFLVFGFLLNFSEICVLTVEISSKSKSKFQFSLVSRTSLLCSLSLTSKDSSRRAKSLFSAKKNNKNSDFQMAKTVLETSEIVGPICNFQILSSRKGMISVVIARGEAANIQFDHVEFPFVNESKASTESTESEIKNNFSIRLSDFHRRKWGQITENKQFIESNENQKRRSESNVFGVSVLDSAHSSNAENQMEISDSNENSHQNISPKGENNKKRKLPTHSNSLLSPSLSSSSPSSLSSLLSLSLAERIEILEKSTGNSKISLFSPTIPAGIPMPLANANSIQNILVQSLQTNDDGLLEYCLSLTNGSHSKGRAGQRAKQIIHSTCENFPQKFVSLLVEKLIQKFNCKPSPTRAMGILQWIRTIFSCHSALLISHPKLSVTLSALLCSMEFRILSFRKLVSLKGKMEFLLSNVKTQSQRENENKINQSKNPFLAVGSEGKSKRIKILRVKEKEIQKENDYGEGDEDHNDNDTPMEINEEKEKEEDSDDDNDENDLDYDDEDDEENDDDDNDSEED